MRHSPGAAEPRLSLSSATLGCDHAPLCHAHKTRSVKRRPLPRRRCIAEQFSSTPPPRNWDFPPPFFTFSFFLLSQSLPLQYLPPSSFAFLFSFLFGNQIISLIQYLYTTHYSSKCCVYGRKDRISATKSFSSTKRDEIGAHLYPSLKRQRQARSL